MERTRQDINAEINRLTLARWEAQDNGRGNEVSELERAIDARMAELGRPAVNEGERRE